MELASAESLGQYTDNSLPEVAAETTINDSEDQCDENLENASLVASSAITTDTIKIPDAVESGMIKMAQTPEIICMKKTAKYRERMRVYPNMYFAQTNQRSQYFSAPAFIKSNY